MQLRVQRNVYGGNSYMVSLRNAPFSRKMPWTTQLLHAAWQHAGLPQCSKNVMSQRNRAYLFFIALSRSRASIYMLLQLIVD